ncbi:MAG: GNAT family N-acetyltransferase [Desulfobulbaceae bacterium]|nr:GNAT family N-acetyltransferase [Desulfobulbaceae bacterium]
MNVNLLRVSELGSEERLIWHFFQKQSAILQSPYFCLEFVEAVAHVRDDVYIAVLEEAGEISGFFPFQKDRFGNGRPVGGALADFHGLLGPSSLMLDLDQLLIRCGLRNWEFHHLVAEQLPFKAYHRQTGVSHMMDISNGFESYANAVRSKGSGQVKDAQYKLRKLQRDYKDIQFVAQVNDPTVLHTLMDWKSKQYQASGLINQFAVGWIRSLLERIFATRSPDFAGMLSALYVDGEPIALHFGMRSATVWNWWFPRHNEKFKRYSPGILLRVLVAQHAAACGIHRIDLGCGGDETYKPRLSSGGIEVVQGLIERPSILNSLIRGKNSLEQWSRQSTFAPLLRMPGRIIKKIERNRRFD